MGHTHRPTRYKIKKSLLELSGTEKAPLAQANTKKDLAKGVMNAKVVKIDLSKINKDGWYVRYDVDGVTSEPLQISAPIQSIPQGRVVNGFLYPDEPLDVLVTKDISNNGIIISTPSNINKDEIEVGTKILTQGNSKIILHDDYIEIITPTLKINGSVYNG